MMSAEHASDVVEPKADDVLHCVRVAVGRVLELAPDAVTPQLKLIDDLGADSLAIVEIAELMEDELARTFRLRVAVDDVALVRTTTVQGLCDGLLAALARRSGRHEVPPLVSPGEGTRGQ